MTLASLWRRLKLHVLVRRHREALRAAEHYREEARRLALLAYDVPDMVATPLKWARLQNGANWAHHYARLSRDKAEALRHQIDQLNTR